MTKSLDQLLAELGSMNYTPPSSYTGYQSGYTPAKYKDLGVSDWNLKPSNFDSFKKEKGKGFGVNLFDVLSGTLGQAGGAITDQVWNVWDSAKQIGDKDNDMGLFEEIYRTGKNLNPMTTIQRGISAGAKEQWKDWTDGEASWGDVPSFGFLHGMDKGWKRGTDIAKDHIGIDNKWGQLGAGIGIDIALDPLTYFTGGLSVATKMSKLAEIQKIASISKGMGLTGKFKTADELGDAVYETLRKKYPNISDNVIKKRVDKVVNDVKGAKAKAYNDNINTYGASIPFSNKVANMGQYSQKIGKFNNPLFNSEAIVPAHLVQGLLKGAAGNDTQAKYLEQAILEKYGINSLDEMTKTQFNHLHEKLSPLVEKYSSKVEAKKVLDNFMAKHGVSSLDELTSAQRRMLSNEMKPFAEKGAQKLPDGYQSWQRYFGETPDLSDELDDLIKFTEKKPRKEAQPKQMKPKDYSKIVKFAQQNFDPDTAKVITDHLDDLLSSHIGYDEAMQGLKQFAVEFYGESYKFTSKNKGTYTRNIRTGENWIDINAIKNDDQFTRDKITHELTHALEHYLKPEQADELMKAADDVFANVKNLDPKTTGKLSHEFIYIWSYKNNPTVFKKELFADVSTLILHKRLSQADEALIQPYVDVVRKILKSNERVRKVAQKLPPKVTMPRALTEKNPVLEWKKFTQIFKHGTDGDRSNILTKNHILGNDTKHAEQVDNAFSGEYDRLSNAKSGFEHWLDKKNPFDARTLQTGDKFLDSMANHLADADSMRVGENAKYTKALKDLEGQIKTGNITPKEMEDIIHIIEGTFESTPSKKLQKIANSIKKILDQVADEEQMGGVLGKLRDNYFPHVVNKSQEEMEKIKEFIAKRDPDGLGGKSSSSGHSKKRTSFETLKERDKYMEDLSKQLAKETDPEEAAKIQEQIDRVANLFDTDVVSALTRRIKEGNRARAMKELQGNLSKYGMFKTNPTDINNVKGMHKLTPDEARKLGLGKGQHYIHPEVFKGMKRIDEIFTDQGMNKFVRHLAAFNDIFRSLVTHYKPSHYRNNFIGNVLNNLAAGVRYRDYKKASKLLDGYKAGTLTYSQKKIIDQAYKHNVISGGFLTDANKTYHFDDPTKLEKLADKVAHNKGINKVKEIGEVIDDYSRLANFVNGLEKYGDVEKAAQQVRKFLFNYNELTNADRAVRMVVPFWNWTKRNIPLQMQLLMENPKFAMNFERGKNLFNEGREGEDWQKESGVKVPFTDYYTSIPSPTADLKTIANPFSLIGSMTPAAKMPIELAMNKKLFNGAPISYGSDGVNAKDIPEYLAKNFGITGNAYDVASGEKGILEALINLINPVSKIKKD